MSRPINIATTLAASLVASPTRKEKLFAIALAYSVPLPAKGTEDLQNFYSLTYKIKLVSLISAVNEDFLLDVTELDKLVRELYTARVKLSESPATLLVPAKPLLTNVTNEELGLVDQLIELSKGCLKA